MSFPSFSVLTRAFRPTVSRPRGKGSLPLAPLAFLHGQRQRPWRHSLRSFGRTRRLLQHGDIWASIATNSTFSAEQADHYKEHDDYLDESVDANLMDNEPPDDDVKLNMNNVQTNEPIPPSYNPDDDDRFDMSPPDDSFVYPDDEIPAFYQSMPPDDEFYQTMPPDDPGSGYVDAAYDDYPSFIEQPQEVYEQQQAPPTINTTKAILEGLNEAQIEAVTEPAGNLTRVLAGPGSGKTRVLTCRIAYLLGQSQNDRVLAVTFTKKAAGEMQQRVEKLVTSLYEKVDGSEMDPDVEIYNSQGFSSQAEDVGAIVSQQMRRVTLGTFHSVCARILRWNSEHLSELPTVIKHSPSQQGITLDGNFAIADQAEQLRVLKEVLKEREIDDKKLGIRPYALLSVISSCKEDFAQGNNPFRVEKNQGPLPKIKQVASRIYDGYRETLIANNHVDFDDLVLLAREMLEGNKDVRDRMRRNWKHLLVDEFQDTSKSQLDVVKLLTSDSLFIVGDPDQSIYSWRGAHVGMMGEVCDHFPPFNTVYLMENYRSTSNIVKAAQKIISSGKSDSVEASMRQDMKPKREAGLKPRVIACADDRAESQLVIQKIREGMKNGDYNKDHEVAIIYRTNAQSRALEEECVQQNVPYVIFGSATSFYQRQEVKDCLCFLRWLANGRDRGAMLRAMVTPTRGIGKQALAQFEDHCDDVAKYYEQQFPGRPKPTSLDVLIAITKPSHIAEGAPRAEDVVPKRAMKPLRTFSEQMNEIYTLAQEKSVAEVLDGIITKLDLLTHVDKISKSATEFEERKQNVEELQSASDRYTSAGPCLGSATKTFSTDDEPELSPLSTFLEDISLVTELADSSKKDSQENRFVACLMTIHASKGMEFDSVMLVGNEEGNFPTSQAISEGDGSVELEEEKRLCYVAMTRAKSELIMTWRKESQIFTNAGIRTVNRNRSRFLDVLVSKKRQGQPTSKGRAPPRKANQRVGTASIYGEKSGPPNARSNDGATVAGSRSFQSSSRPFQSASRQLRGREMPRGARAARSKSFQSTSQPNPRRAAALPRTNMNAPRTANTREIYTQQRPQRGSVPSTRGPIPKKPIEAKARKPKPKRQEHKFDSSWIFPIGSEVVHSQLGRGIVLPPPSPTNEMDMPVLVKFSSGKQEIFSARGSDLSPAVGG